MSKNQPHQEPKSLIFRCFFNFTNFQIITLQFNFLNLFPTFLNFLLQHLNFLNFLLIPIHNFLLILLINLILLLQQRILLIDFLLQLLLLLIVYLQFVDLHRLGLSQIYINTVDLSGQSITLNLQLTYPIYQY